MLDLHNHVLFGLDDGCRTPAESVALAERAKAAGHRGFVATPHIRPGMFDNDPDGIRRRRDEVAPLLEPVGIELFLGAEYYFAPELLAAAKAKTLLTLGESSRYVLIELPLRQLPPRFDDLLYEIRLCGYVPVIAHPERCEQVARDLDAAQEIFARNGVLLQLDAGSLVGHYGRTAKKASERLVKSGAYHVAACDLHRPEDVDKIVAPSRKVLEKLVKKRGGDVEVLLTTNPRRIVEDAPSESIEAV
ncbi:MAG: CpsB/CapC family capsule biosynthesis tyrosine phosphatase [Deltaproteobacteria bacterium]